MEFCKMFDWRLACLAIPASYVVYRLSRTVLALCSSFFLYRIVPWFYKPNLKKFQMRWTVVSGATDGIGKAYTMELARRGLRKFLLIGRNAQKLSNVKEELEEKYENCCIECLLFDFYSDDYDQLRQQLKEVDIGLVVNSVGVGRDLLERFGDNVQADRQLLRVNALGAAEFLSCVLPPMESNGGGQIVVLSSTQGIRPIPLLATYSAAKSLMSFLSECIDREYSTIHVQCLTPALVATKMTRYEKGSLFVVTAESFAREAVSVLGLVHRTSGCFNHEIQMLISHLFPWCILKHLLMPVYWRHQKRMLQLQAKENVAASETIAPPSGEKSKPDDDLANNNNSANGDTVPLNPQSPKISKIPTSNGVIRNRA